jgi:hypothetical protein
MAAITGEKMKLTVSTVALVALAMAVSVSAAGVSQDRPEAQKPGAMDASGITLSGCVARGTATDSYTLAEVKKDATAAPATATAPAELVALTGTDVDLSKHVGHSVTVTGSFASGATGTSGTAKPAAPATTEDTKKAAKTFTVKSLKMVAPSCQP